MFVSQINTELYWKQLEEAERILQPTSKIIGILESDRCSLSDIYKLFKHLQEEYNGEPELLKIVKDRWDFAHTASMGFAYFLDPTTKAGNGFIEDDLLDTLELLKEFIIKKRFYNADSSEVLICREIENFTFHMNNLSQKEESFIAKHSAYLYWVSLGRSKFPILHQVAEIVFKIPTSQASAERSWSIFDFLLSKKRGRLRPEKLIMLAQLYKNADLSESQSSLVDVMMGNETDIDEIESE